MVGSLSALGGFEEVKQVVQRVVDKVGEGVGMPQGTRNRLDSEQSLPFPFYDRSPTPQSFE